MYIMYNKHWNLKGNIEGGRGGGGGGGREDLMTEGWERGNY